ncbi:hypothetical protein AVEN_64877-1 [Araneus ventricosus]|uniref:Uncharacterized protein n=1 Tax=Araneus ventricosus TaxID=182803 RepID=A0A4Y2U8Z2_ARAVE|nr:hypothetical protein AVEN_64877-1 [Araneus ventricosus]
MLKLRKKILKIEESLTRSRDLHQATLLVETTVMLKSLEVAFNSSHEKHDWNTKQLVKKGNINSRSILHLYHNHNVKKRRHACSTLLSFMLFFAKPVLKQVHLEHCVHCSNYNIVLFTDSFVKLCLLFILKDACLISESCDPKDDRA